MVASVVGHALMIAVAVAATRTQLTARVPEERIVPLPALPSDPPARAATGTPATVRPSPGEPTIAPPLATPIIVPEGIVPIDTRYGIAVPDPREWPGTPRGRSDGLPGASRSAASGDYIPFASGVDKPAMALADNPAPRYPEILRRSGVRGEVTIEVVIDTTGRAEMESLRIIATHHPLLSDAVRSALERARFLPAETAGRKVRMWVRQSFVFEVR